MKKNIITTLATAFLGITGLQAQVSVSGQVFNAPNGGVINVGATNSPIPDEQLVAVLISLPADTISQSIMVSPATGAFQFNAVLPGSYYVMVISPNESVLPGNIAPSSILETGWTRTGESLDATGIPDGAVDGKTEPFSVAGTAVNGIMFGLQQRPVTHNKLNNLLDKNATSPVPLSVQTTAALTQGGADILSGEDYNGGSIVHYSINQLPRHGTLYLAGTAVNSLAAVSNLSPAQISTLSYLPGSATLRQESDLFTYTASDNVASLSNPSTYIIPFGLLDADKDGLPDRSDVDDDNDGITDLTECGLNDFSNLVTAFTNSQFTRIRPSHFDFPAGSPQQRTGLHLSKDLSSFFGKPAGSVIVTINNANTHPNTDEFYSNDSTGASVWTVSGTLGAYTVTEHGQQFYSYDTRTTTFFDNGIPKFINPANGGIDPTGPGNSWITGNDGYNYWLKSDTALRYDALTNTINPRLGLQFFALTDPGPKYFQMASDANNKNEWATYFIYLLPECDFDNDGIPNRLDLDSDNDGCLDVIEGNNSININETNTTSSGLVSTGSLTPNRNLCETNSCIDATGLPLLVAATGGQAAGTTYNNTAQDADCAIPLPVQDLQFEVYRLPGAVHMKWQTKGLNNSQGFEIQRSIDGKVWDKIGFLSGLSGKTDHSGMLGFDFRDVQPAAGRNMYRLKLINNVAAPYFSEIRTVFFETGNGLSLYPNPVEETLLIDGLPGTTLIEVYDIHGSLVLTATVNGPSARLDLNSITDGVYLVAISGTDGSKTNSRIVKSKRK